MHARTHARTHASPQLVLTAWRPALATAPAGRPQSLGCAGAAVQGLAQSRARRGCWVTPSRRRCRSIPAQGAWCWRPALGWGARGRGRPGLLAACACGVGGDLSVGKAIGGKGCMRGRRRGCFWVARE
eukprot:363673-Chlamydomonas_euryale.AAC.3